MLRGPDVRLRALAIILVALLVVIVGRLFWLQVLEHEHYQAEVQSFVERAYDLPEPPWGVILDRNGDLLVGNVRTYDISVLISSRTPITAPEELTPILGLDDEQIAKLRPLAPEAVPEWRLLTRDASVDVTKVLSETLLDLKWTQWVTLTPSWSRYYAEGSMACHVLGAVNEDGGGYGVQGALVRLLRGERIEASVEQDPWGVPLAEQMAQDGVTLPRAGVTLRLTIDRTLQAYVEGELDQAIADSGAEGGTIIVMDPSTGELLAIASRPGYEPARFREYWGSEKSGLLTDPAASKVYEPGSVMKVVTVAAALDSGAIGPNWSYYDTGTLDYAGVVIHNWDLQGYGQQGLQGVLDNSLNTGVATITTQYMTAAQFYKYILAFGFGKPTNLEVASEEPGLVHLPTDWDWSDSHLATNGFGQGIAVTPLQMASAVAAIANGGEAMQLHLVAERRYPGAEPTLIQPQVQARPISATTAQLVTQLMVNVVEGRLTMAAVPGYHIAGKSGTAQIPGYYNEDEVITSFIGFGPVPNPRVLVLVKIDRPQVPVAVRWGTRVAAPVFQRVMARTLVLLGIPPADWVPGR